MQTPKTHHLVLSGLVLSSLLSVFWGLFPSGLVAAPAMMSPAPARERVLFPFDDVSVPFNKGLLMTLVPGSKSAGDHGTGFDPKHPNKVVVMPGNPGDPDDHGL